MHTSGLVVQIANMFILMGVGFLIHKLHMMSEQTSKQLVNILFMVISPCVIVHSFQKDFSASRLHGLAVAFLLSMLFFAISSIVAKIIFLKVKEQTVRTISEFGAVYPNMGFLGIPLVQGTLGNAGVFFAAPMLAASNIFTWSIGVNLYRNHSGKRHASETVKKILLNPNIIAIAIGFIIFMGSIHLPDVATDCLSYISDANTPIAMFVVGDSLAEFHFSKTAFNPSVIVSLLLRNLLLPMCGAALFFTLGTGGVASEAILLLAACPSASMCVLFAIQEDMNPTAGISLMTMSTLLCILTIPLIFSFGTLFS